MQATLCWPIQITLYCPLQVPYIDHYRLPYIGPYKIPFIAITKYPIYPNLCTLNVWTILDIEWGFLIIEQNLFNKYNQYAVNYLKASQ